MDIKNVDVTYLGKLTKTIYKVHGENHPELEDVYNKFIEIKEDLENNNSTQISEKLKELRSFAKDYKIPDDVCETYVKTYEQLQELELEINQKLSEPRH